MLMGLPGNALTFTYALWGMPWQCVDLSQQTFQPDDL